MGITQSTQKTDPSGRSVQSTSGGKRKIVMPTVKMKALTFTSAHEEMHRNYEAKNWARRDWGCSGTSYSRPHWRPDGRTVPISHTRGEHIRLQVQLRIRNSEICGQLIGEPVDSVVEASGAFRFASEVRTLGEETHLIEVVGQNPLPAWPQRITQKIQWRFQRQDGQSTALAASGPHTIFVTFGEPVTAGGEAEQGATRARMEEAMRRIDETRDVWGPPDDGVELVHRLLQACGDFVLSSEQVTGERRQKLERDSRLKAYVEEVDWPKFTHNYAKEARLREQGGAWPLASLREYGGQCQAIARLIRGILHQAGFRDGTIELRYVTADFRNPHHAIVNEEPARCTGPAAPDRQYVLISSPFVAAGRREGTTAQLGANVYEAFIRYRYREEETWYQAWYPAGVSGRRYVWPEEHGDISQKQKNELLHVFLGMAEGYWLEKRDGRDVYRITDYEPIPDE